MSGVVRYVLWGVFVACAAVGFARSGIAAQSVENLYTLAAHDGFNAGGPLLAGRDGALYGTLTEGGKIGGGTVFRLAPPHPPVIAWTFSPIYSFPSDTKLAAAQGTSPYGPLIQAADGSIIGTASGVLFSLQPPAGGGAPWKETVLAKNLGPVIAGQHGELYGLTVGNAVNSIALVRVSPATVPGGDPTVETIYQNNNQPGSFALSFARERSDGTDIYGVSNQPDSVFRFRSPAPGASAWTKQTLHTFAANDPAGQLPHNDLIVDRALTIFGSTSLGGGGFAHGGFYKLTAPLAGQTAWTERVVYKLADYPDGAGQGDENSLLGLVENEHGVLFGTNADTGGGGFIFSLTPTSYGGNSTPWNRRTLYGFPSPYAVGANPSTKLTPVQDSVGHVSYAGMTSFSQQAPGLGTIYRFTP